MRINENNGNIIIKNIDHFNLDNIFNSGQIFRFNKSAGDIYTWAAYGRIIKISQTNDKIIFYDMTTEEFKKWTKFFALDEDYESIDQYG
jgi:N-glycosylase/DNA lyase